MRCFVVAGFLLTSASRGPSAIAEFFVQMLLVVTTNHIALSGGPHEVYELSQPREQQRYTKRPTTFT